MRHNCSPFEIVHCDGVYVLRLHSRSSTKRLRALCMANETWTLIIPPHYMVDHAGCCCQLQPTKSRKCSSSPCGWWEFFVTNGQKVLNFSFDFMHLLPAPKSVDEIEKAWFLLAKVSLVTQQLDGSSKVIGDNWRKVYQHLYGTARHATYVLACVKLRGALEQDEERSADVSTSIDW